MVVQYGRVYQYKYSTTTASTILQADSLSFWCFSSCVDTEVNSRAPDGTCISTLSITIFSQGYFLLRQSISSLSKMTLVPCSS